MIYAQKGNRVIRIEEHQVKQFVDNGYNIIDQEGRVLRESVPTDPIMLKTAYVEKEKRISELLDENKSLRETVKSLTEKLNAKKSAPTTKTAKAKEEVKEEKAVEEDAVAEEKKPAPRKNTRRTANK